MNNKKIAILIILALTAIFSCKFAFAYIYNENPTAFGNFPKTGELRIYYQSLIGNGMNVKIKLTLGSQVKYFTTTNGHGIIDTDLQVSPGQTITAHVVEADANGGDCVGWIMAQDNKCGSGLPNGNGGYFGIINVSE